MELKGLSLFSNVGVAELCLKILGVEIVVANEILEKRAKFYQENHPNTEMIIGNIKKKKFIPMLFKSFFASEKLRLVALSTIFAVLVAVLLIEIILPVFDSLKNFKLKYINLLNISD